MISLRPRRRPSFHDICPETGYAIYDPRDQKCARCKEYVDECRCGRGKR